MPLCYIEQGCEVAQPLKAAIYGGPGGLQGGTKGWHRVGRATGILLLKIQQVL